MRFYQYKHLYIRCLEFTLHDYLGYLSLNYPKYKFFQGRWFTKQEWEVWQRQGIFREHMIQKHFPEIHARQIKAAKFLLEFPPYQ